MNNVTEILDSRQYFNELRRVAANLPEDTINRIADELMKANEFGRMIYLFGNGGSASLASHFACDLGKGTACRKGGKRFRVLALTDNIPSMTAWANDSSYEDIFAEQLRNFVEPQDIALGISGSGNSRNVLNALRVAREAGAKTIGITGFQGGAMKVLCDICVVVPSDNMQIIEDLHLSMAHSIFRIVSTRMVGRAMTASRSA
ncbi:MAG: D-sedoheptulose-7-phosphate isomerase [Terriglobia bacterium]